MALFKPGRDVRSKKGAWNNTKVQRRLKTQLWSRGIYDISPTFFFRNGQTERHQQPAIFIPGIS
jgi:hypothetical protein